MGNLYSSKKRILSIKFEEGGDFMPVGYLTTNDFSENVEMIDTTTSENEDGWRTRRPLGFQTYDISFAALQLNTAFAGGDFNKISYDRLKIVKRSRKSIEWRLVTTDLQFVDTGVGHIVQLVESAGSKGFLGYTAQIEGYGKPEFTSEKLIALATGVANKVLEDGNNNFLNV